MHLKTFVDVLFILLLGTMVMLTRSIQLGALDTVVATMGAEGVSPVRADQVQVIVVGEHELLFDGRPWQRIDELAGRIRSADPVLLITADRDVRHHRVMAIWSALQARGLDVKLGAQPARETPFARQG